MIWRTVFGAIITPVSRLALFVPCFVDQLYPRAAIAALRLLERLGLSVDVPDGAACCGQPPANAGFEDEAHGVLGCFADTFAPYDRVIVLSGSCAMHVRTHARDDISARTTELCEFLHDEIGLDAVRAIAAPFEKRVGLHIGCHALRGIGLAKPSELHAPAFNKVRALLGTVEGLTFAELDRPDECCGFGGTFSVTEPEISSKMGRDRLRDYAAHDAEVIVSTDMSCMLHLGGIARRQGIAFPMMHVAEVLAGESR